MGIMETMDIIREIIGKTSEGIFWVDTDINSTISIEEATKNREEVSIFTTSSSSFLSSTQLFPSSKALPTIQPALPMSIVFEGQPPSSMSNSLSTIISCRKPRTISISKRPKCK